MHKYRRFIDAILLLALLFAPFQSIAQARSSTAHLEDAHTSALMTAWSDRIALAVRNPSAGILALGYTVQYTMDSAALVSASLLRADCADLRITYGADSAEIELDRQVENCNTNATVVRFRTQQSIAAAGRDVYHLYYGNSAAGAAPANPANIFAYFDDFEDGNADGWNAVKGTWNVVTDSGNSFYRYSSGGATWALSNFSLPGLSDLDFQARVRGNASTSFIGLAFRIQDANNFLTVYESKDVGSLKYAVIGADNHTIKLEVPGFPMLADTWFNVHIQALGNLIQARFWPVGQPEPSTWPITYTDATFQSQGNFGLTLYNHTTAADWDDIQVRRLAAIEPVVEIDTPVAPITAWAYRAPLTVTNSSTTESLQTGYTVQLRLDTAALVADGKLEANCSDLRIGQQENSAVYEIDRVVEQCNTSATRVWFALDRPLLPGASDAGYYLFYGDGPSITAMQNSANVFLFFEDWENGASHWTSAAGLDTGNTGTLGTSTISSESALSPTHSQKFPSKQFGGDAFSGFIPVSPSTSYAISTWARAGESTRVPVGFDPYTAAYAKGNETWLWAGEWDIPLEWGWRSNRFTTTADTAYLKIKSEWWSEAAGTQSPYLDNIALRYAANIEPTLVLGLEETTLVVPLFANILDNRPVNLGGALMVSADVSITEGTVAGATLRILTPVTMDIAMTRVNGTDTTGTWQASYTPSMGGPLTYRILARSALNRTSASLAQSITIVDSQAPVISTPTFTDPLLVRAFQTVTVNVTDNGALSSVKFTVGGVNHDMTAAGSQYTYTWRVDAPGLYPFTITALDSAGNQSQVSGQFTAQVREADVCTWKDCKVGAESWSIDDGVTTCKTDLENAGIRGTYYYNGASTLPWFAEYSVAGHEVSAHTTDHQCNPPCCSPTCTPETLAQCAYTTEDVNAYRTSQLEPNIAAIEAGTGKPVLSMAWSCGCTDPGRMSAASNYFLGARGYADYIANLNWIEDVNPIIPFNYYNLNASWSYNQTLIDRAFTEGKWAVITSHGSCEGIDYMGSRKNDLWAAPVGDVLKYIYVREAAQLTGYLRSGRTITFNAAHTLSPFQRPKVDGTFFSPIAFDNAVSLKVHLLDTDAVQDVLVDGVNVPFLIKVIDGARFVVFDAALDRVRQVTVNLAAPAPAIGTVSDNGPVELGGAAAISAVITIGEGSLRNPVVHVLSPQAANYPMSSVPGQADTYRAQFTPTSLGPVTYQISAENETGLWAETTVRTFQVIDSSPPAVRAQNQSSASIKSGESITLSIESKDIGGLQYAALETDESGVWHEYSYAASGWWNFSWPVRVPITLTESQGLAREHETVDLAISAAQLPGLANCAAELRVVGPDQNEIPVQVYNQRTEAGNLACNVLFQASVPANQARTYYIYYGNSAAQPPVYTTDLTSAGTSGTINVHNTYFDLDLNSASGVITRMRLPLGSNADLPLANNTSYYLGWHQVCSSLDGNITGSNSLCQGGTTPASGLTLVNTLNGPLVKEYTLTSTKGSALYTIVFRFFANSPVYHYSLTSSGTGATVMNNFWFLDGSFSRLSHGTGSPPFSSFVNYSNTSDLIQVNSLTAEIATSIDGQNNDGISLGGSDYINPTATGLDLWVATGANSTEIDARFQKVSEPLQSALAASESLSPSQYGSPVNLAGATDWTPITFPWQNPAILSGTQVQWRVKLCDLSENCTTTAPLAFSVQDDISQQITLQPGWNLVSFYPHPQDRSPVAVLSSLNGFFDLVYAWDAVKQDWLKYDPIPNSPDSLEVLDETMGFWLHITGNEPRTFVITGSLPVASVASLVPGWNLVGQPSNTSSPIPASVKLMYTFDAADITDPWKVFDRDAPAWVSDLAEMRPGHGYWAVP